MRSSDAVRLLKTLPHPCGYFGDRVAQNLVIDPLADDLPTVYDVALTRGFRRAGGHIYRPACARCQACVPARLPVNEFVADRSQRRCIARNADIDVHEETPQLRDEYFALYQRYLAARHRHGGMDDAEPEDFTRFLTSAWSKTRFLAFRRAGTLVALAVTDVARTGLSSVYTFYEPDERARGLGTFAILSQIDLCRRMRLPHVYLGYWISAHAKMAYKDRFHPLEVLRGQAWTRLERSA
jgi:leucyl-tRNA---protein transferase